MKCIKYIAVLILFIFLACSKSNFPFDSGNTDNENSLNSNYSVQQAEEIFNSLALGVAKTFGKGDYLNEYKNEIKFFRNQGKRLHIDDLFKRNAKLKEGIAHNMDISVSELGRILNSLPRKIEIDVPFSLDKLQQSNEFLVTYFAEDDIDLSQGITSYNRKGENKSLDLTEEPDEAIITLRWSRSRFLGNSETEKLKEKMDSFNLGNMILNNPLKKKPILRLPPGTITNVYIDYTLLYDDKEPSGDAEVQGWVKDNTSLLYGDQSSDDDVYNVFNMDAVNHDYTHYYNDYTIYNFEVEEAELTLYLFIVENDYLDNTFVLNDEVIADYFTIQIESDFTATVDDAKLTVKHEHIYP